MGTAIRRHWNSSRHSERIALCAKIRLTSEAGLPIASIARCTEIGLGGLRVTAAQSLAPGTRLHLAIRLPRGRVFECDGRVAWSKQTLHPALFGSTSGCDDDGTFGIAFENTSTDAVLPIARLFAARDHERARARKLRRLHGFPLHA